MNKTKENIIVQLASPERKYVKVYHDFLDNSFLTTEEQMILIVLKSYIDFRKDSGDAYPSMETICKRAKMSEKRARKNINALIKKGIVKKVHRGLTKTNLYTLADYAAMWECENVEDVAAIADNKGIKPLTPEEHIAELERMGYKVEIKKLDSVSKPCKSETIEQIVCELPKSDATETELVSESSKSEIEEKELVSAPTKAHSQAPNNNNNNNSDVNKSTTNAPKSQTERYTMQDLEDLYEYDCLIRRNPDQKTDIDIVFNILYDTLNTTRPTIRVGGEDKPTMVVIGRLTKLQPDDLLFAIDNYHEQTDRIKNVRGYLLTLLYHAREQSYLDLMNLGHYNGDF